MSTYDAAPQKQDPFMGDGAEVGGEERGLFTKVNVDMITALNLPGCQSA